MPKKSRSWPIRIIIVAAGLLFGWMVAAMVLSGGINIDQFYQSGEIYDIDFDGRMAEFQGIVYDVSAGGYTITEDQTSLTYTLKGDFVQWNYICMNIVRMGKTQLNVTAYFYMDGVRSGEQEIALTEGKNYISLSGEPFNSMIFEMKGQTGTSFTIQKMQFRENAVSLIPWKFIVIQLISAVFVWMAGVFILHRKKDKNYADWYLFIDWLQGLFITIGDALGAFCYKMPDKKRRWIRAIIVFVMVTFMSVFENLVYLHSKPYYGISMTLWCLSLLILAGVSLKKRLHKINWRNPLVASWLALWILAVISDVFVDKRYQYQGLIMIFFMGFFFFVWNNMESKTDVIQDIMWGCEATFWVTTLFIYFCRPQVENFRFMGFFRNPNIEAAFGAAAFILFLVELDNRILRKKVGLYGVFCAIGLTVAFDRTWRSGGRTGQMAVMAALAVFVLHNIWHCRKNKTLGSAVKMAALCLLLAVPILYADNWIFHNLSERLGTQVVYPKDLNYMGYEMKMDSDIVFAAESLNTQDSTAADLTSVQDSIKGRRTISSLLSSGSLPNALEAFSSGRTLYYVAYFRQMNLLGHYYHARNWGDYIYPHNGLLEIMYRYGIFAGIPYAAMLITSLWYAFLYARRKGAAHFCKLYPLIVTAGMCCILLLENGEKPFVWMIWILYYFGIGCLFDGGKNPREGKRLESE